MRNIVTKVTALEIFSFVKVWYGEAGFLERPGGWIPPWIAPSIAARLSELISRCDGGMRGAYAAGMMLTDQQRLEKAKVVAEYCLGPMIAALDLAPSKPAEKDVLVHDIFAEVDRQFSFED